MDNREGEGEGEGSDMDPQTVRTPWEKRARALMCKWANCVDQEATTDEEYDSTHDSDIRL